MSEIDDFRQEIMDKVSKIPGLPTGYIDTLLRMLPYANERRRKKLVDKIKSLVETKFNEHSMRSKNPLLSFPSKADAIGDGVIIGHVCSGDRVLHPFGLTSENLRENEFVVARSGHGKTTTVFNFVDQLIKHEICFLSFDWKQDYRTLAKKYDDVYVIRWHELAYNVLTNCPEGMDIKLWWRVVLDIAAHSQGLLMATPAHILRSLEELYEHNKGQVTFRELENHLKSQHSESRKENEYSAIAENRIFNINQALDKVINVKHGFEIKELFKRRIIIEMFPLDFSVASFLIQTIIMHEFYRRLYNQIRLNRKSTLDSEFKSKFCKIIMDEAHLTQYSGQERSLVSTELSLPPLATFFSQSREMMLGTFALTQFPHLVMDAFKDNAGTMIVGNIVESDQQRNLSSSLGLDRDSEKILGKLEKGTWIARVAGRTKPFVLKTLDIKKGDLIADAEVLQRSRPLITALDMKRQEIESRMFMVQVEKKSEEVHLPNLTKEGWLLLDYVFFHEWSYQQQITEALGISDRKFAKVKQDLLDKNLIRIQKFPVKVHDRIHFSLTPNALEIMKILGRPAQRIGYWKWISGVPGYEHHYWLNVLRVKHKILGWNGRVEYDLKDGRRVDLYEELNGHRKAVEIELSTKDVENKVRVLTDREVDELVLLYREESAFQFARSKLERMKNIPKEKIWVGLIRDYVELLDNVIKDPEKSGNIEDPDSVVPDSNQNRKDDGNNGVTD